MNINPTHLSSQMRFMRSFDETEVSGLNVSMKTTNSRHINSNPQQTTNLNAVQSFGNLLQNFIQSVNADQVNASELQLKAITNPENVNVHQVTSALSKAEMSLSFFKAVNDRLINGFRELNNLR